MREESLLCVREASGSYRHEPLRSHAPQTATRFAGPVSAGPTVYSATLMSQYLAIKLAYSNSLKHPVTSKQFIMLNHIQVKVKFF